MTPRSDLNEAWAELGSADAARAHARMRQLRARPDDAVALLDKRLATATPVKAAVLERLVHELDDDDPDVRFSARECLEELGDLAGKALTLGLRKAESLEARRSIKKLVALLEGRPRGKRLQVMRAVEVLESIGSPAARRTLKRLAEGVPEALITREAKAASKRLDGED